MIRQTSRPNRSAVRPIGSLVARKCAALLLAALAFPLARAGAQLQPPGLPKTIRMEADQQRKDGDRYIADGNVLVQDATQKLRADHAEYYSETGILKMTGHVQFDSATQHIDAEQGEYDVKKSTGTFSVAHGTVASPRQRPNPMLLLSTNPVYFEAKQVDRIDEHTYRLHSAWMTVCMPQRPTWKFFAAEATLHVDDRLALINSNFRILRVPLFYTPYASLPVGPKVRQSGFTIPDISNSSIKGTVIGDSFYWAPNDWSDAEFGAELYSKRGWAQYADIRVRPTDTSRMTYSYFGVQDRGLNGGPSQTGHQSRFFAEAAPGPGWRAVADVNELSSLTFRLAFSTSYSAATNSELVSAGFLTKNFNGYSFNFAAEQYRDFLSSSAGDLIELRKTPEMRFDSVERQPWSSLPFYFAFDSFSGGNQRSDPQVETPAPVPLVETPAVVERSEVAPRATVPLHFGSWLGVTTTVTARATHYGGQVLNGVYNSQGLFRTTGEVTTEFQMPAIERVWGVESSDTRWKHSIEPEVTYSYVGGLNDFSHIIRFDQYDTLTDTNYVQYGIIQRLFRKKPNGSAEQILYWRVAQEYFFDPTFGGALLPGQRNVFAATSSLSAFAFENGLRRWSPIVSDFRITPGGRYDIGLIGNYDPVTGRIVALGAIANLRPYRESFLSFSEFNLRGGLQPEFNQLGMRVGWGQMNRKGLNVITTMNYDVHQHTALQQAFQISYNGSCCGLSFEYRRLALGPVQSDNQFRIGLLIANFGTFGNMRRQERLF